MKPSRPPPMPSQAIPPPETTATPMVSLRSFDADAAADVHPFHQVVLGFDGEVMMAVNGIGERIGRCAAWLVPAGARHEYAGVGENRHLVLDLPPASLAVPARLFDKAQPIRLAPDVMPLVASFAAAAPAVPAASAIAATASSATPPVPAILPTRRPAAFSSAPGWQQTILDTRDAAAAHRFHWRAAAQLCNALVGEAARVQWAPVAGLDFARIDCWLRAHLAEPLRIAALACDGFINCFSMHSGKPPHQYLLRACYELRVMMVMLIV